MNIFVIAGEPSGDLHGGHLVASLKEANPEIRIEGVAGPCMRKEGVSGPLSMEDFQVMGFSDVLKNIFRLYTQFKKLRTYILQKNPQCIVFIDYPGFNLRMAKALRKSGYKGKLIYYISPSVWAHGKKRATQMAKYLDLLLTIYPFEAAHFSHTPLPVEYVGNPICNYVDNYTYDEHWKDELHLDKRPIIGIFPGSRPEEIKRNFPLILEACQQFLLKHPNVTFCISCATEQTEELIRNILQKEPQETLSNYRFIPRKWTYELMKSCKCAIAKSGTITLELALHDVPTLVVYKLTWLNKFVAKYVLRLSLPHYCIVNILCDYDVFPELIANEPTAQKILDQLKDLYGNEIFRKQRIQDCQLLHKRLNSSNASSKAANAILQSLA